MLTKDETDALVKMARECGLTGMHVNGKAYVVDSDGEDITPKVGAPGLPQAPATF